MDIQKLIKTIRNSQEFYMDNFLKIRTKEGTLVEFKCNPAQKKSIDIINRLKREGKPVRIVWLKARQLGISTLAEGLIFHDTANNILRNSLIIAHEDKASQNLFSMSKLFYEELPPFIRPMKKYSNESALAFENPTNDENEKYKNPGLRSKITVATARNIQTARSNTFHNVHCSEVAFWDDAETLMTGLLQCIPDTSNSMVLIESTANGMGGWFYDFWKRSERGETDYVPIFLSWFENPDYSRPFLTQSDKDRFEQEIMRILYDDKGKELKTEERLLRENYDLTLEQLNWRMWCIANKCNGDLEKFKQEYPSTPDEAFIVSGRPQFNVKALREYQTQIEKPLRRGYLKETGSGIEFVDDDSGYIKIWKEPEQDKFYSIGGDVAEGLAHGDYSCGVVLSDDYDMVASWHGHIDPDLFGEELYKLARYYNDAYLAPETNNHGHTTLRTLFRREYWNLYYQKNYSKISNDISQKPGWATTSRTKPLMIDRLSEFVREKWLGVKWDTFISEAFTYMIDEDGKTNAQSGCHDDTIMATAIALQLLLENLGDNYVPEQPHEGQDTRKIYDGDDIEEEQDSDSLWLDKNEKEEYTI